MERERWIDQDKSHAKASAAPLSESGCEAVDEEGGAACSSAFFMGKPPSEGALLACALRGEIKKKERQQRGVK